MSPTQSPVKDMELRPKAELAPVESHDVIGQLIELAKDPQIDVAKIEKLIDANERGMRIQAKMAFDSAFSDMQGEMPTITERGEIKVGGSLRSRYARYEDIIEVVRPILKAHGFALRYRNEVHNNILTVVGVLSHRGGHSEEDRFDCPPDHSGGKADIQAIGSTRSYGQRYTTIALLNIVTKGQDNDGNAPKAPVKAPAGFDNWFTDFALVCKEQGMAASRKAWKETRQEFREFAQAQHADKLADLRKQAEAVQA